MALVGFTAQQCVRRPWSTAWRLSGWDDLGDYQQSGALAITIDTSLATPGGCTQATIVADGNACTIQGQSVPGFETTAGTRNPVVICLVGDTVHIAAGASAAILLSSLVPLTPIAGAASIALGAVTSSASGLVLSPRVGMASVALGAVVSSASGVVGAAPVIGSASVTLGAVTATAAGTVASAGNPADPPVGATTIARLSTGGNPTYWTARTQNEWELTTAGNAPTSTEAVVPVGTTATTRAIARVRNASTTGSISCHLGQYETDAAPSHSGFDIIPIVRITATSIGLYFAGDNAPTTVVDVGSLPATAAPNTYSQGSGWAARAAHLAAADKLVSSRVASPTTIEICSSLDGGATWVQLAIYTRATTTTSPSGVNSALGFAYQALSWYAFNVQCVSSNSGPIVQYSWSAT